MTVETAGSEPEEKEVAPMPRMFSDEFTFVRFPVSGGMPAQRAGNANTII